MSEPKISSVTVPLDNFYYLLEHLERMNSDVDSDGDVPNDPQPPFPELTIGCPRKPFITVHDYVPFNEWNGQ